MADLDRDVEMGLCVERNTELPTLHQESRCVARHVRRPEGEGLEAAGGLKR